MEEDGGGNEWGAVVINMNGEIVNGPAVAGGPNGTSWDAMVNAAVSRFGPGIIPNIVGSVHSHPTINAGDEYVDGDGVTRTHTEESARDTNAANRFPSGPDWSAVRENYIAYGVGGANGGQFNPSSTYDINDFTIYIVGPDGVLREYEYDPDGTNPGVGGGDAEASDAAAAAGSC